MKVKVIGAGSIGNHLANAARRLEWQVDMCDIDLLALERTQKEIYPSRYGAWDPKINLHSMETAPKGDYDLICIGTPPDSHLSIAKVIACEKPRAVLVEKPLCEPGSSDLDTVHSLFEKYQIKAFIGYDHTVGDAVKFCEYLIDNEDFGKLLTIDVEFREHWGGIFAAHHWLDGPADSYLGFTERGGGALCEHSHAINLWQHFALKCDAGLIDKVSCTIDYVKDDLVNYDSLTILTLQSKKGILGRCVQDVVTKPSNKHLRLQFQNGFLSLEIGKSNGHDLVSWCVGADDISEKWFQKTRPDDFINELKHIKDFLENNDYENSPININRGYATMSVIKTALWSQAETRTLQVKYPEKLKIKGIN
ncbi:Gfo/Idh/MocA family protein [Roseobacter sp. HKCCD5988]|uniref:Gfo/Idh/MocA family protein n=1 Tax=Roseobacter sp. HKCCD5988 TaxID=3120338 RepID=UPI0030EBD1FA